MVTIRLAVGGSKKKPYYHINVADRRDRRDGRYIERLGFYNPQARGNEQALRLDTDRIDYWLSQGAKPSDRVEALIKTWKKQADKSAEAAA